MGDGEVVLQQWKVANYLSSPIFAQMRRSLSRCDFECDFEYTVDNYNCDRLTFAEMPFDSVGGGGWRTGSSIFTAVESC